MSNSITQDIQYKQTVVEYSYRHGVTKAAIKFKMYRKKTKRMKKRCVDTISSNSLSPCDVFIALISQISITFKLLFTLQATILLDLDLYNQLSLN